MEFRALLHSLLSCFAPLSRGSVKFALFLVRPVLCFAVATGLITAFGGGVEGLAHAAAFRSTESSPKLTLRAISTQPQFVSGGDVRIEVIAEQSLRDELQFILNGQPINPSLTSIGNRLEGVVSGLVIGANKLEVRSTDTGASASMALTNYPITGPILSGPHLSPYECRTIENGFGEPLDANCSVARQISYWYKASNGKFKELKNPAGPRPRDLVTTTTIDGAKVPYIVRVDSGTINRGVYRIAVLDDPSLISKPWKPSNGWNKRLIVSFACCMSANYNQGTTSIAVDPQLPLSPFVLSDNELSKGFAYMVSSELWNNQHANPHLQGETLMMLKEHFIEQYGVPKWTAGKGASGGAIQQYLIAQMYPGLLDGIQPRDSFPETIMPAIAECRLFQKVFAADSATWTVDKRVAVQGFNAAVCPAWHTLFAAPVVVADNRLGDFLIPLEYFPITLGCGLRDGSKTYHPLTNPNGARCSVIDTQVNLLGRNPATGFTRRPLDNVGMQYGLGALKRGNITVDEFLSLNEAIGGFDSDGNLQAARMVGDAEALRLAYEGGLINSFKLSPIPIITWRRGANTDSNIHDNLQDLTVRTRLQKANGRSDNQIIFKSGTRSRVDLAAIVLSTMTRWLDNLAADPAPASFDKVARNKPKNAVDTCWDSKGKKIVAPITTDPTSECNQAYPLASNPRIEAGQSLAVDVLKCQLKAIDYAEYGVAFTQPQMERLKALYPNGVCDYSKPGVGQLPLRGTYLKLPLS